MPATRRCSYAAVDGPNPWLFRHEELDIEVGRREFRTLLCSGHGLGHSVARCHAVGAVPHMPIPTGSGQAFHGEMQQAVVSERRLGREQLVILKLPVKHHGSCVSHRCFPRLLSEAVWMRANSDFRRLRKHNWVCDKSSRRALPCTMKVTRTHTARRLSCFARGLLFILLESGVIRKDQLGEAIDGIIALKTEMAGTSGKRRRKPHVDQAAPGDRASISAAPESQLVSAS